MRSCKSPRSSSAKAATKTAERIAKYAQNAAKAKLPAGPNNAAPAQIKSATARR
jgi:hypothetical protein